MCKKGKPCGPCPWTKKGQPDISEELILERDSGGTFICHITSGICHGATNTNKK